MAAAARQLGVSRMTLHRLLRGEQAVTPRRRSASASSAATAPRLWLRMQMAHDLRRLERKLHADLTRIPTYRAA